VGSPDRGTQTVAQGVTSDSSVVLGLRPCSNSLVPSPTSEQATHAPVMCPSLVQGGGAPDLPAIQRRIKEVVAVLDAFSTRRDPARSRADYIALVGQAGGASLGCMKHVYLQGPDGNGLIVCHTWACLNPAVAPLLRPPSCSRVRSSFANARLQDNFCTCLCPEAAVEA
jgi:hypothetical protein